MRRMGATLLAFAAVGAAAQTVTLSGSMGDKALLIVDGTPRTVAAGGSFQNIKLLSVAPGEAVIEMDGQRVPLLLGSAPVDLGRVASEGTGSRIVLTASSGGHFTTGGSINGKAVRFVVDTGATYVSLSESEADRIGLAYKSGPRGMANTANGQVGVHLATLDVVRVGDVQVYHVQAVVMPASTDRVLLGNSFLARFQMKRENDQMTLDRRP
jgi:aspartyl protease family protein